MNFSVQIPRQKLHQSAYSNGSTCSPSGPRTKASAGSSGGSGLCAQPGDGTIESINVSSKTSHRSFLSEKNRVLTEACVLPERNSGDTTQSQDEYV